jgi:hypothetical protein
MNNGENGMMRYFVVEGGQVGFDVWDGPFQCFDRADDTAQTRARENPGKRFRVVWMGTMGGPYRCEGDRLLRLWKEGLPHAGWEPA